MYDYSFNGILDQIAGLTPFSLIYIIGLGFIFGAVAAFYWGIRRTIIFGAVAAITFFIFLSFRETGLTSGIVDMLFSFFSGILYMFIGVVAGAVLSQLVFNVNN